MFEHRQELDDSRLLGYAQKVALDIDRFKKEMSGNIYAPLIIVLLKSGIDSDVEGIPTFFVNGVHYGALWDLDTFSNFLKKNLNR